MNELISIITPVYNAQKYIEVTIQSVLNQTYENFEWIMVDDGSTDATVECIRNYSDPRIRPVIIQKNMGAATARNRGMEAANGRYIAFLDADDIWKPQKLANEMQFMEQNDAAFVFTGYEFADSDGNGNGRVVHAPRQLQYRQALKNTTIFTSTVMLDTEKIPSDLLHMPNVKSEDTAMWWKILHKGIVANGLDENLVLYRRPGNSLSSDKIEAIRRIWGLYRRCEHLNLVDSCWNFIFWAFRAVIRRI